jgi:hypothetical protein
MNAYAALKITDAHPCPYCDAITGEYCTALTGALTRDPHVLRINMAKRATARVGKPVPCPAECGDDLVVVDHGIGGWWVQHARTDRFECGRES